MVTGPAETASISPLQQASVRQAIIGVDLTVPIGPPITALTLQFGAVGTRTPLPARRRRPRRPRRALTPTTAPWTIWMTHAPTTIAPLHFTAIIMTTMTSSQATCAAHAAAVR